jgi:hypothetical protein
MHRLPELMGGALGDDGDGQVFGGDYGAEDKAGQKAQANGVHCLEGCRDQHQAEVKSNCALGPTEAADRQPGLSADDNVGNLVIRF